MYNTNLKLTIHTAFLGSINQGVRALAYECTNTKVSIYAYFDREPTENDYDIIDRAISEIMASYPQFQTQEIILTKTYDPIRSLNAYQGWIFIRYEG